MVVGEGFEPSKSMTADLQSAPFGRSGTPPKLLWCRLPESNWWPTDYKSVALPIELTGQYTYTHLTCDTPFQRTCGNWTTPYRFCGKRWNRITLTGFSVRRIHHVCHLSIFSLYPHTPHRREKQCGNSNYCCGDSTRTNDLWAMIPASYQLLHSAILSWKLLCTHNIHIYVVLASTTLHSQYNNTIDIAYIS